MDPSPGLRRTGGRQQIPRPSQWRAGALAPWADQTVTLTAEGVAADVAALDVAASEDRNVDRSSRDFSIPPFPGARLSAVLIALVDGSSGAEVLLTRRSMALRNHRGEISFPGGRVDPGETVDEAALREAFEEVALDPQAVRLAGHLRPISTVVSLSHIVPVVGVLQTRPVLHPSAAEVDRVLWVPLSDLLRDGTYREEWWGTAPTERPIHFFELDDETVWGATARLLHQLLGVAYHLDGPAILG